MTERIDCFLGTEQLTWHSAHKLGLAKNLVALKNPINKISAFLAISKHTKQIDDPKAFMAALNTALEEVLSDGTYDKLLKHYQLTPLE